MLQNHILLKKDQSNNLNLYRFTAMMRMILMSLEITINYRKKLVI